MRFNYEKVRELREAQGLTLRDVAKRMKCSPQWIQKIESGENKINIRTLERILIALNISDVGIFFAPESTHPHRLKRTQQ